MDDALVRFKDSTHETFDDIARGTKSTNADVDKNMRLLLKYTDVNEILPKPKKDGKDKKDDATAGGPGPAGGG